MADPAGKLAKLTKAQEAALLARLSSNPSVRAMIAANLDSIARVDPQLAARVRAGDQQAILDAYRMITERGESLTTGPRGKRLPTADAAMAGDNVDVVGMAASKPPAGFTDGPSAPPTAMIPYGVRGPGVPVGGPRGSGVTVPQPTALSTRVTPRPALPAPPPQPRALSTKVNLPRIETTAAVPVYPDQLPPPESINMGADIADDLSWLPPGERVVAAEFSPDDFVFTDPAPAARADSLINRLNPATNPRAAAGAGIALGAGGAALMNQQTANAPTITSPAPAAAAPPPRPQAAPKPAPKPAAQPRIPDVTSKPRPATTAELAAATRPPPSVMTLEPEAPPADARTRARALNAEINRREYDSPGWINSPEAMAMKRERDSLHAQADEESNAAIRGGRVPPSSPDDDPSWAQARAMMAGIQAGTVPNTPATLREINRLQEEGNARRRARVNR